MNVAVPPLGTFAFDDTVGSLVAAMLIDASRDEVAGRGYAAHWRRRIARELAECRGARVEPARRLPRYGPTIGRQSSTVEVAS